MAKTSIAVLPTAVLAASALDAWKDGGGKAFGTLNAFVENWTGFNMDNGNYNIDTCKRWWLGAGIASIVHLVANNKKLGINAKIRKLTGGYLSL